MDPKVQRELRFLKLYAVGSSLLFVVLITLGATRELEKKTFGEIDVQRARRILEELRRRLADPDRPQIELDYLERLLKDY